MCVAPEHLNKFLFIRSASGLPIFDDTMWLTVLFDLRSFFCILNFCFISKFCWFGFSGLNLPIRIGMGLGIFVKNTVLE